MVVLFGSTKHLNVVLVEEEDLDSVEEEEEGTITTVGVIMVGSREEVRTAVEDMKAAAVVKEAMEETPMVEDSHMVVVEEADMITNPAVAEGAAGSYSPVRSFMRSIPIYQLGSNVLYKTDNDDGFIGSNGDGTNCVDRYWRFDMHVCSLGLPLAFPS